MSSKGVGRPGLNNVFVLTDREKQVYELRKTKSTKEVAAMLNVSEANVRKLFENARDKICCDGSTG
jgi:DNA-directed RNA polymerase specialized sigma subunit